MSLMALIAAGHQGHLVQTVAVVLGVEEPVARSALERLVPAVAHRLRDRAAEAGEQDGLLDVLAEGGFQRYLDDPRVLFGREAVRDGEDVLGYAYGSVDAARAQARAIGPPAGLDGDVFARLMTLAAVLLIGAMSRRLDQQVRAGSAAAGPAGILKRLGRVVVRALAEGSMRSIYRRRAGFGPRMAARRRRPGARPARRPTLEMLLGDVGDSGSAG